MVMDDKLKLYGLEEQQTRRILDPNSLRKQMLFKINEMGEQH
jgi:hypothetical protein